jgi:hypothetical protein
MRWRVALAASDQARATTTTCWHAMKTCRRCVHCVWRVCVIHHTCCLLHALSCLITPYAAAVRWRWPRTRRTRPLSPHCVANRPRSPEHMQNAHNAHTHTAQVSHNATQSKHTRLVGRVRVGVVYVEVVGIWRHLTTQLIQPSSLIRHTCNAAEGTPLAYSGPTSADGASGERVSALVCMVSNSYGTHDTQYA